MLQSLVGTEHLQFKVAQYLDVESGWKWEMLNNKLTFANWEKLAPVALKQDEISVDKVE